MQMTMRFAASRVGVVGAGSVGLLAYPGDKQTYDTQAAQGFQLARSLVRGTAAVAHERLPRPAWA